VRASKKRNARKMRANRRQGCRRSHTTNEQLG
jgi:hypothetical protein